MRGDMLFQCSRFVEICHYCHGNGEDEGCKEILVEEYHCLVECRQGVKFFNEGAYLVVVVGQTRLKVDGFEFRGGNHALYRIDQHPFVHVGKIDVFHASAEQTCIHEHAKRIHPSDGGRELKFQLN